MKISYIEQVLEVAKVGSISQAANNLYMSQPNLSLCIKKAESELGIQIFKRTSTGVELTRQGKEFVDRAMEIVLQIDALEKACSTKKKNRSMELRVASMGYRVLDIEIGNMLRKYETNPIGVNTFTAVGTKLLDIVAENEAEIGFCTVYSFTKKIMMRQISLRNLEYRYIGNAITGVYVSVKNKLFSDQDKVVDFQKLQQLPMVMIAKREFNAQTVIEYLMNERGIVLDCPNTILVSNFYSLRSMVSLTNGFAIASYLDISYEPQGYYPELRFIPFEHGVIEAEFGCVQRENVPRSLLANEVVLDMQRMFT